ncbi:LysR family transcriptional regulator [Roseovarius sp. EL26]|uniref:LysR family transcriptional regulator n=1 Tax=Roseovarius sp. EL26 TaxID=2126672 RepID=UPI000EA16F40|nr:LysR family transcriptional regulator [Roseovarius sp. EL26]
MDPRGIKEAISVADTGSFTAAAASLTTTVASVSRRISELEARLGVKLFIRTTRQVSVTPDGENYLSRCREAVKILEAAELEVTAQQDKLTGHIRITAAVDFGERVIAPSVASFQMLHPDVSVELDLSNDRFDLVERRYDLAVRLGEFPDSTLIARKIGERRLLACASPKYIDQHGAPQTLADLRHHNCLRGSARQWRFAQNDRPLHQHINGMLRCNSGTALTRMALQGSGIAQLPDYYVKRHIAEQSLISILPDFQPEPEGIWIVRPDNRYVPRRVREFITLLTDDVGNLGSDT